MHCLETNLKQIIKDQHCLKMPSLVFDFFPRKKKVVKADGINGKAHISAFESYLLCVPTEDTTNSIICFGQVKTGRGECKRFALNTWTTAFHPWWLV